tara:strand:+ start:40 stop:246 length:207 start_codon:yes stop_codon:yes gene_type:complete
MIYVKRNPLNYYGRYKDPKYLPFIQWKRVSRSTAYNMTVSKQQGWEQSSTKQYKQWLADMKEAGHNVR